MSSSSQGTRPRAKLICGVCGRVLDRLFLGDGVAISRWGTTPLSQTAQGPGKPLPPSKPSVRRQGLTWLLDHHPESEMTTGKAGRVRYTCHPRCGADYPLRLERITAAMEAGKTRIVAGVDV